MNNFDKINNALKDLSENDKKRLGAIIVSAGKKFQEDPIRVLQESLSKIETEYTDEKRKELGVDIENALLKDMCSLFSSNDYIEWLTNFTLKNDYVETKESNYKIYETTETDKNNLDKLKIFFKGIEKYANDKQIKSFSLPDLDTNSYSSCWYYIKYKDTILKISASVGKLYSSSISSIDSNVYIEFNHLMKYFLFIENNKGFQRERVDS